MCLDLVQYTFVPIGTTLKKYAEICEITMPATITILCWTFGARKPFKWSVILILSHLPDSVLSFSFRLH
jgi:hypothetical protein